MSASTVPVRASSRRKAPGAATVKIPKAVCATCPGGPSTAQCMHTAGGKKFLATVSRRSSSIDALPIVPATAGCEQAPQSQKKTLQSSPSRHPAGSWYRARSDPGMSTFSLFALSLISLTQPFSSQPPPGFQFVQQGPYYQQQAQPPPGYTLVPNGWAGPPNQQGAPQGNPPAYGGQIHMTPQENAQMQMMQMMQMMQLQISPQENATALDASQQQRRRRDNSSDSDPETDKSPPSSPAKSPNSRRTPSTPTPKPKKRATTQALVTKALKKRAVRVSATNATHGFVLGALKGRNAYRENLQKEGAAKNASRETRPATSGSLSPPSSIDSNGWLLKLARILPLAALVVV
ncbi:hypothetical protein C8R43DRAFT_1139396 [Mycena crocata]|nr:hypothetical protein C8R43DRAFT_1142815 [Mycena crocata]KAJ7110386.1 hypothetical protein C8R43DRAFT_1139396 [Mycena crocata]